MLNLINSKGRDSFQNCYYEAETKKERERTNVRAVMATVFGSGNVLGMTQGFSLVEENFYEILKETMMEM